MSSKKTFYETAKNNKVYKIIIIIFKIILKLFTDEKKTVGYYLLPSCWKYVIKVNEIMYGLDGLRQYTQKK
jgi:hypothetical protein